ncbi:YopX family protein [Bacillus haynesii]|uniref:YopX family protein n=1 Tax=Bacillus haynesii TaxID=1925021 RepID=UPI0022820C78|nr:YopX family protein [Bacillus haynesii]MCY8401471.1 YopX family protein [Bacillus haynesii]
MREIKFRYVLRDRVTEEIFDRFLILNDLETGLEVAYDFDSPRFIDCELVGRCEYTGLKDKNGREIYEGDVVKGINFNMTRPQRFIGEVEYSYNGYTVKGVKQYTGLRSELNINFEVIGDVYRNPDLLEAAE